MKSLRIAELGKELIDLKAQNQVMYMCTFVLTLVHLSVNASTVPFNVLIISHKLEAENMFMSQEELDELQRIVDSEMDKHRRERNNIKKDITIKVTGVCVVFGTYLAQ